MDGRIRRRPSRQLKKSGKGRGKGSRKGMGKGKGKRSKGSGKGKGGSYRVVQRPQPASQVVHQPPQILPQVLYQVPQPVLPFVVPQPVLPYVPPVSTPPAPVPIPSVPSPQAPSPLGSFLASFFRPAGGGTVPAPVTPQQTIPADSPPLQTPTSTCSVDIKCQLLSGAPCSAIEPRDTNCEETVFYTIQVCNTGPVDLQLSSANFIFNGFSTDALAINQIPPSLSAGACEMLDPNTQVNACEESTADSSFAVSATAIGSSDLGLACEASASDSFSTGAPVAGGQERGSFVGGPTWLFSSTWAGSIANGGGGH